MIPLVGHVNELVATKALLEGEAKAVEAKANVNVEYVFETMIEVPRGALTADEIAKHAAFFSFGTNDLTQMTFGYSRDDAEGGFLLRYVEGVMLPGENHPFPILPVNPFQTLDDAVAGLMKTAVEKGRATRPDIELGICGEHGGDPESIWKCEAIGLDYVSCPSSVAGPAPIAAPYAARRLLLLPRLGLAACGLAFLVLALVPAPPLIAIFVIAFLASTLGSFDQPARSSSIPRLVPPERLPAAIALNQLNFQAASVVGPAVGGVLIAVAGLPVAYGVDVLSFAASIFAVWRIAPLPRHGGTMRPGLAAIREGLRFTMDRRLILATFVIGLDATIFGMPTSLFPVLALEVFRVGPAGLGLLAAAPAIG